MAHRRHSDSGPQHFTIDQANATLPLVRVIVRDAVAVARDVDQRRQRIGPLLEAYSHQAAADSRDPYLEEVVEVKQRLEEDKRRLEAYHEELAALGVRLVDPLEGRVEFPTQVDRCRGWLSWTPNEKEILYWRPDRSSRRRRLPLAVASVAGQGAAEPPSEEV